MIYTIYKITNKVNGKVYIGKHQTNDIDDGYMGSGKLIQRAVEKYGSESFEKEILYKLSTEEEMNAKEAELVTEEFCNREDTYNLCPGGHGGFGYINSLPNAKELKSKGGKTHSHKHMNQIGKIGRASFSEKLKDSKELRDHLAQNFGDRFLGRSHTQKSKDKISQANSKSQSGSRNSQFGTMWITNGTENRKIKKLDHIPEGWYRGRV